ARCSTSSIGVPPGSMRAWLSSVLSSTWVPYAASTIRKQASAHVLGFSCRYSGSSILIPFALEGRIRLDLPCPLPHELSVRPFRKLLAVVQQVAEVALMAGGVTEIDGDDPSGRGVCSLLWFDSTYGPERRKRAQAIDGGLPKDLLLSGEFRLCPLPRPP